MDRNAYASFKIYVSPNIPYNKTASLKLSIRLSAIFGHVDLDWDYIDSNLRKMSYPSSGII